MELFKVLGICLVTAVLAVVLSQHKKEYALFVAIAASVLVFLSSVKELVRPLSNLVNNFTSLGIKSSYFLVAVKVLAIGHITQFVADLCRDFSQSSLAAKAELAGKTAVFLMALPLVNDLFSAVGSLVK